MTADPGIELCAADHRVRAIGAKLRTITRESYVSL